jgi:hypothetical protein
MVDVFLESLIHQATRQQKGSSFGEAIRRGGPDRERKLAARGFQVRPPQGEDDFEGSYGTDVDDGTVATSGPQDVTRDLRSQLPVAAEQPGFHPKAELVNGRVARASLDKRVKEIDYRMAQVKQDLRRIEGEAFQLKNELQELSERKQKIIQGLEYADSFK